MLTRKLYIAIIIMTCLSGLTSCSTIMLGLYGMKRLKPVNENAILKYSKKYDIPIDKSYELDSSYFSFLSSIDNTLLKTEIKNHSQPLQALYFNNSGQLQSFQINCYAGGFPNLNWKGEDRLTIFPPKQQAPVDSILSLDKQLKYLRPLSQTTTLSVGNYDYIVIVYWNKFMGRQSKRLIHFIHTNSKLAKDKKVIILYANNDNIFAINYNKNENKNDIIENGSR